MSSGSGRSPRIRFVRATSFSAAHRYYNPNLSDDDNRKLYGSLYRERGFGHNFWVEAHFEGDVEPLTGMIVNLVDVDRWLKAAVSQLDHKDLNQLEIFRGLSPTPEKIAEFICLQVKASVESHVRDLRAGGDQRLVRLEKVRLHEGDDLWVDVFSDS